MLTHRHFFPSNDRVRQLELHPVQPWLATASRSDVVTIWDWNTRQVVQQFQLGALGEEDMCGDADLSRLHSRDPEHSVNPSAVASATSRTATGKVREVKFFDPDVAQLHLTTQHLLSTGPCRPAPNVQDFEKMGARRLLLVTCDAKVLLYELGSKNVREVTKAHLEGKSPTCCAFLMLGGKTAQKKGTPLLRTPVLAIGCSDGIVRLVTLSKLGLVGRLVGHHKSAVAAMSVITMRGGTDESILVAHAGGNVQRFVPSDTLFKSMVPKGELRDIFPVRVSPKSHKNILSMAIVPTAESPEITPGRMIVTCGADKNLVAFAPGTMQELFRIRLPSKEAHVATCPRGMTTSGAHTLLLGTDFGALFNVHLESGSIRCAVDLNELPAMPGLPANKRPQASILHMCTHPLLPQLVAVATNMGSYLLQYKEVCPPLPYVALPLTSPAQALASPVGGIEGASVTYVVAVGGEVHCVTVAASEHEQPLALELEPPPVQPQAAPNGPPAPQPQHPQRPSGPPPTDPLERTSQQLRQQQQDPHLQRLSQRQSSTLGRASQQQQPQNPSLQRASQQQQQPQSPGLQHASQQPPGLQRASQRQNFPPVQTAPPPPPPKKKGLVGSMLGLVTGSSGDKEDKYRAQEVARSNAAHGGAGAGPASPMDGVGASPSTSSGAGKKEGGIISSLFGGSSSNKPASPGPVGADRRPASEAVGTATKLQQRRQQQQRLQEMREAQARAQQQLQQQQQEQKEQEKAGRARQPVKGADGKGKGPQQQQQGQQGQQQKEEGDGEEAPASQLLEDTPPEVQNMVQKLAAENAPGQIGKKIKINGLPGSPAVHILSCNIMDANRPASRAVLSCSTDGSYVAVVWPAARQYTVYHQGATSWETVASGSGIDIAWGWNEHLFAVVEAAMPVTLMMPPPTKASSKKAAAKEAEMRRAQQIAAEEAAAAKPNTVQIMRIQGRSVSGVGRVTLQGGDPPLRVHSGPLLGITTRKQLPEVHLTGALDADAPLSFRLHTWDSNSVQVGQDMPEPLVISWDPTGILVALAYPAQVLICSVTPMIKVLASLPIQNTVGIQWAMRQLFVLTQTHAYAVCVYLPGTGPGFQRDVPIVQLVLEVAAQGATPEPSSAPSCTSLVAKAEAKEKEASEIQLLKGGAAGGLGAEDGPLPSTLPRPPGLLTLLGPRGGVLWVANAHAQALALPLGQHPVLNAISIAAAGNVPDSVLYAKNNVHPSQHGILAYFLAAGGGDGDKPHGANNALTLPGLTLLEEFVLRLKLNHWQLAFEAMEALLAGFHSRPPADGSFRFPATTAAFGSWSGASDAAKAHGSVPGSLTATPLMASSTNPLANQPYEDDMDWMLPLRQAGTSTSARTASAVAASPAPRALPPPHRSCTAAPLGTLADLALDLLRGLIGTGMHDAAQPMARMLLDRATQLSPRQLSGLCTCMTEVDMRRELPALLAKACVPGADAMSREGVGLLGAIMSGHTSMVNEVLRQAGAPALAAAQSDWAKDEYNNETVVAQAGAEWVAQLAGQAQNMAPPTTPSSSVPHLMIGKKALDVY